jgi:hypothetical protein
MILRIMKTAFKAELQAILLSEESIMASRCCGAGPGPRAVDVNRARSAARTVDLAVREALGVPLKSAVREALGVPSKSAVRAALGVPSKSAVRAALGVQLSKTVELFLHVCSIAAAACRQFLKGLGNFCRVTACSYCVNGLNAKVEKNSPGEGVQGRCAIFFMLEARTGNRTHLNGFAGRIDGLGIKHLEEDLSKHLRRQQIIPVAAFFSGDGMITANRPRSSNLAVSARLADHSLTAKVALIAEHGSSCAFSYPECLKDALSSAATTRMHPASPPSVNLAIAHKRPRNSPDAWRRM